MTEERSRSNEETPKWVQTVASIRGELMTRFSDRLSMEEIASCAYAVAMRDGQGGTGMVEEERSRLEAALSKIATIALRGLPAKTGYMFYADEVRLVLQELLRAALEDRQEAAPLFTPTAEDARVADALRDVLNICESRASEFWEAYIRTILRRISISSGVPSEATPTKEGPCPFASNSPWFQQHPELCRRCTGDGTVVVGGHSQELQDAVRVTCQHCKGTGKEPCVDQLPAPAPEVQGTPTKESEPKFTNRHGKPCSQACYEGRHAECTETFVTCNCTCRSWHVTQHAYQNFASVPVGTPQKETPPKQCTWVDRMDFTGGIQCNFQRGHKGQHSFEKTAPVPEGVQGKEPQTFEQRYAEKDQALEERARAYENTDGSDSVYSLLAGFAFQERKAAYLQGEAAGWLSAITEMQEWANHDTGTTIYIPMTRLMVIAKCSELLEKTK